MAKDRVPATDDLFVIFRISNDLEYGERFYNIRTSSKNFWYLNKYHVPHGSIILMMSYISRTVRKKKAQAMFITDDNVSAF